VIVLLAFGGVLAARLRWLGRLGALPVDVRAVLQLPAVVGAGHK
jgi:hypothetical protein